MVNEVKDMKSSYNNYERLFKWHAIWTIIMIFILLLDHLKKKTIGLDISWVLHVSPKHTPFLFLPAELCHAIIEKD